MDKRFEPLPNLIYSKISEINDGKYHNIYCVLLEIYDWKKSAGSDYVMSLKVSGAIDGYNFIFIKIFSKEMIFQDKFKVSDIIRVRNIKFYKNNLYVIDHNNIIDVIYREGMDKNTLEDNVKDVVERILLCSKDNLNVVDDSKVSNTVVLKTPKKIKDINIKEYINFTGSLINIQVESSNLVILTLTDDTCNSNVTQVKNNSNYSNDMVLYVKVWDALSKNCIGFNVGDKIQINNLKVFIKDNTLQGTLSNNISSTINKISEVKVEDVSDITSFSNTIENVKFDNDLFSKIKTTINEIKTEGFYKLSVRILRHHPHKGYITYYCRICRITGTSLPCDCRNKETYVVLKLLVEDTSGSNILLCKNKIAEYILKNRSSIDLFECLITSHRYNEGLLFEIIDLPFFYKYINVN